MIRLHTLFACVAEDAKGDLWFFDRLYGCLWKADQNFENVRLIRKLREDLALESWDAQFLCIQEEKIYITSQSRADILEYDGTENRFRLHQNPFWKETEKGYYNSLLTAKGSLFLIPHNLEKDTYLFDVQTQEYQVVPCAGYGSGTAAFLFFDGSRIWMPVMGESEIRLLDTHTHKWQRTCVVEGVHLSAIWVCGEDIWAVQTDSGEILRCRNGRICQRINSDKKETGGAPFSQIVLYQKCLYCLPRFGTELLIYHLEDRQIERITLEEKAADRSSSLCYGYYRKADKLYLLPWRDCILYEYDCGKGLLTEKPLLVRAADWVAASENLILEETKDCGIAELAECIQNYRKRESGQKAQERTYGERIYTWINGGSK